MLDIKRALQLAKYAKLVYQGYTPVVEALESQGITHYKWFDEDSIQALVAIDDIDVVVAFRGTEPLNIKDWMIDCDIDKVLLPFGVGKVAEGTLREYKKISKRLFAFLEDYPDRVYITGHSMGGGLATICATDIINTMDCGWELVTFGCPRVGDGVFADEMNKNNDKIFRWVNKCDIVTRLPMRIQGFEHVGTPIYIDSEGIVHTDTVTGWDVFLDRLSIRLEDFQDGCLISGIKDHSLDSYIKAIQEGRIFNE